jgi:leucyl aminopeptidase (aminopeptidase T)
MTARPEEVVAWQFRFGDRWAECTREEFNRFQQNSPLTAATETRELIDRAALQSAHARLAELEEALNCRTIDWNECRESMQSWAARARNAEAKHDALAAGVRALADEWEIKALELDSYAETKRDHDTAANLDRASERLLALLAGDGEHNTVEKSK